MLERAPNLFDPSLKIALEEVSITPVSPVATKAVEAVIVLAVKLPPTVTKVPSSEIRESTNLSFESTLGT